jgi:FemAB-related protein (PEP-CTERM system-associated)
MTDASAVVIREAADVDGPRWDRYVRARPEASAYHLWAWRRILADSFGHLPRYLLAERDGVVVGALPLVEVRSRLFGHSFSSLPFCPYAGPVADDASAASSLVDRACAVATERGAGHLELRGLSPASEGWPAQDLYVTFRRSIVADHDRNLEAIPRKQRAMVRKGLKNGLTDRAGDLGAFHRLYSDNVHRHGTPGQSQTFFRRILDAFGGDAEVLVVHAPDGAPLSAVLTLYFRDTVLPYFAGDTLRARELAANDFKYWRVMQRAADRGATTFDFGRSKRGTGPFDFKRNWGFEPTPLHYQYRLLRSRDVPQLNPLNPRYRLMIETWRRLPAPLVGWLGPRIVGGLG